MTDYIVSARKYRPKSFTTLIGQDNIAKTLLNSIRRGQLAHAYLFCGPRGVGKTTSARIFAKMINCSSPLENGEPCGHCESCQSFEEGNSYCIQELDAASNNSVEDIKELIDKVRTPPQVGKYSVYIIDEVHMLSQAAFNAFLKTLEEPPEHAIFILATTEKHKILPTILSRCQTYDFNRITVDSIVRNLRDIATKENINIDDESLHVIAIKADGAMRDALTIFDQTVAFCGTDVKYADVIRNLNVLDYEYSFSLVGNFLAGDYASALRTFDEILAKGFNALHFVASLSSHLRDLVVAKAGGLSSLLELADSVKARYAQQAESCSEKFLFDALTATTQCEQGYKTAVNPRLHIEFCLMRLCFLSRTPSTAVNAPVQTIAAPAEAPAAPAAKPKPAETPVAPVMKAPTPVTAEPAPAAEPQPVKTALPKLSFGISLSNIAEADKQKAVKPESKFDENTPLPTDHALQAAWDKLCEISTGKPRFYNAIQTAKLSFSEEGGYRIITYALINSALKSWMDGNNSHIEAKFRELLGNPRVKLVTDVQNEGFEEKVVVSAEDKAREMIEKNPQVKELVTGLGLEIK